MPYWETFFKWLPVFGLFLNVIGSIIIGYEAIISKKEAVELGSPWLADEENEEANYENPPVKALITQSRNTIIGFVFLIIGFILQLISSWPK